MLYTPLTKQALKICIQAHAGQVDKSGMPYLLHPVLVADAVEGELETCVALLHDVVEDTPLTLDDLLEQGMPSVVVEAVSLMTHASSIPYMEYVAAIKQNPLARAAKLADLSHNMDLGRLDEVGPKDLQRVEKYRAARDLLLAE